MTDLTPREQIERATHAYAEARDQVRAKLHAVQAELREVGERHRLELIALVDVVANARASLESLVDANRSQFNKPRTVQYHGIKVGLQKQPGRIAFDDEESVIRRIREKLASQADELIAKKESLSKEALRQLPDNELRTIGVSIVDCGDSVLIKATDDAVDKLIKGVASEVVLGEDLTEKAI